MKSATGQARASLRWDWGGPDAIHDQPSDESNESNESRDTNKTSEGSSNRPGRWTIPRPTAIRRAHRSGPPRAPGGC